MTSAHTQAILEDNPIYLTGEKKQITVKSKRSYSHRIKVHKRRSIKPQLVKHELNARDVKERRLLRAIQELGKPREFKIRTNLKKIVELLKKISWNKATKSSKAEWRMYEISRHNEIDKSFAQLKAEHMALAGNSPERRHRIEVYMDKATELAHKLLEDRGIKRRLRRKRG